MKKFKNLQVGVIEVVNDVLAKQYEARPEYYEPVTDKPKELTLNELKAKAKEMGIEYDNKITKAEILVLINEKENN